MFFFFILTVVKGEESDVRENILVYEVFNFKIENIGMSGTFDKQSCS